MSDQDTTASALRDATVSVNECDSYGEPANLVDALFFIGRAIHRLAGAIEVAANEAAVAIKVAADDVATSIGDAATSIAIEGKTGE